MIKRLEIWLLKSLARPLLASWLILVFILVFRTMATYYERMLSQGSPEGMWKLFGFALLGILITALPLAILAGTLLSMGRMGEQHELVALKACGLSLFRVSKPLLGLALLASGLSLLANIYLIPNMNRQIYAQLAQGKFQKGPLPIKSGYFYDEFAPLVIRIADQNKTTKRFQDVLIYDYSKSDERPTVWLADSAMILIQPPFLQMAMYHGSTYDQYPEDANEGPSSKLGRIYFDSLHTALPLPQETQKVTHRKSLSMKGINKAIQHFKLRYAESQELKEQNHLTQMIREHRYEYANRLLQPLNCIAFMLLGIGLGAMNSGAGLGRPVIMAMAGFGIYYAFYSWSWQWAKLGQIGPVWSAAIPILIFGGIAMVAFLMAAKELKEFSRG